MRVEHGRVTGLCYVCNPEKLSRVGPRDCTRPTLNRRSREPAPRTPSRRVVAEGALIAK
jgi:hypothetical protein